MVYLEGSQIFAYNEALIGDVVTMEDGYKQFFPKQAGGYWPTYLLRGVADIIDEVNRPWEEQIANDPIWNNTPSTN